MNLIGQVAKRDRLAVLGELEEPVAGSVVAAAPTRWQQPIPVVVIAVLMILASVALGLFFAGPKHDSAPTTVVRFPIDLPRNETVPPQPSLALSPDGSQAVYAALRDKTRRLYLRRIDQLEAEPIPATVGKPQVLFEGMPWIPPTAPEFVLLRDYDSTDRGRRFLMVKREETPLPSQMKVVLNCGKGGLNSAYPRSESQWNEILVF